MNMLAKRMTCEDFSHVGSEPPFPYRPGEGEHYDKSAQDALQDVFKELREVKSHGLSELAEPGAQNKIEIAEETEIISKREFLSFLHIRQAIMVGICILSYGIFIFTSYDLYLYRNKIQNLFDPFLDLMLILTSLGITVMAYWASMRMYNYKLRAQKKS